MSKKKVDFLIVGQGLAGTCLGWHLIEKGARVAFVDPNFKNASSKVAAGLWHGLTFRKLGKTWLADEGIPYLYEHYQSIEKKLGVRLISEQKVARIFRTEQQEKDWEKARDENCLNPFLKASRSNLELEKDLFDTPHGADEIDFSGRLNLSEYLEASKTYFKSNYPYFEEEFSWEQWSQENLIYKGLSCDKIVFAEGHQIKNNLLFSYLPVGQTKGEVLKLNAECKLEHILNSGVFLLTDENGDWLCGSNFEWNASSYAPTSAAKDEILSKLKMYYKGELKILQQVAGIRPTSPDRRPILGDHPEQKNHFIYNGLGTKGVLIAPLVSKIFSEYLLNGSKIPDEMHVKRFEKFH